MVARAVVALTQAFPPRPQLTRLRDSFAELSDDTIAAGASQAASPGPAPVPGASAGSGTAAAADRAPLSSGTDASDAAAGSDRHLPPSPGIVAELQRLRARVASADEDRSAAAAAAAAYEARIAALESSMRDAVSQVTDAEAKAARATTESKALKNKLSNANQCVCRAEPCRGCRSWCDSGPHQRRSLRFAWRRGCVACRAGRVRKDKMMEELGEARLQVRQLKKQVHRLQQQLALAEKQATLAMEAHLPKPGDSYDDSFEAVLREEMLMMKAGFELKIQLLTEEVR